MAVRSWVRRVAHRLVASRLLALAGLGAVQLRRHEVRRP